MKRPSASISPRPLRHRDCQRRTSGSPLLVWRHPSSNLGGMSNQRTDEASRVQPRSSWVAGASVRRRPTFGGHASHGRPTSGLEPHSMRTPLPAQQTRVALLLLYLVTILGALSGSHRCESSSVPWSDDLNFATYGSCQVGPHDAVCIGGSKPYAESPLRKPSDNLCDSVVVRRFHFTNLVQYPRDHRCVAGS